MEHKYNPKDKLSQIPKQPGIYKMLDANGNIIYIGKSKCLRNRVQSYFVKNPKWEKVTRMVSMIKDIEYMVTDTHLEARLLECTLIKDIKPRFNAQMKNDGRYFYIKVENYNKHNALSITDERTDNCFGPFRSRYTISDFLGRLKNFYPIRKSNGRYEVDYHIIPLTMEQKVFYENREVLLELLQEEENIVLLTEALQVKLEEAAAAYRFEMASVYRDLIICFGMLKNGLNGYKTLVSRDILLKLPVGDGYKMFYVSGGNIINTSIIETITEKEKEVFLKESKAIYKDIKILPDNEKAQIDFRDILYSEISDLPLETVEFLS
jgi:excinuclease ABC subunit C